MKIRKVDFWYGLTLDLAVKRLESMADKSPEVIAFIESIKASERGLVR